MEYRESSSSIDTAKKILKVNHAGEFGAINIYRAQILFARLFDRDYRSSLEGFLHDEERHMQIFWEEIKRRNGVKCKSYWLCGIGGWFMGFISSLFGKSGVMACTWAVESVVVSHLYSQLAYLRDREDHAAYNVVKSILDDEKNHRDFGQAEGGKSLLYAPFRFMVSAFTEGVIRFGMR